MNQDAPVSKGLMVFGAVLGLVGLMAIGKGLLQDESRLDQPRILFLMVGLILIVLGLWLGQAYRLLTARYEWARLVDWGATGGGLFALMSGILIIGMSVTVPADEINAPRWVAALFGGVFAAAGLLIIKQYALDQGIPDVNDITQSVLLTILLTCFGVGVTWISIGPGERNFTTSISIPFLTAVLPSSAGNDLIGRVLFFLPAVILDVLAVFGWIKVAQNVRQPPEE